MHFRICPYLIAVHRLSGGDVHRLHRTPLHYPHEPVRKQNLHFDITGHLTVTRPDAEIPHSRQAANRMQSRIAAKSRTSFIENFYGVCIRLRILSQSHRPGIER